MIPNDDVETYTRAGVTYRVVDPFYEFTESETVTRKNPEGRTRMIRLDRIETVSDTYEGGGCTVSVSGYHYHVTLDREDVMRLIKGALNPEMP